jgi:hypothetical protein
MAYGSDFRVKYLIREIQRTVTKKLKDEGLKNPLLLRVFDESEEDSAMWAKGGLTFNTPSGELTGASDAAWYLEEDWFDPHDPDKNTTKAKPVLVVEGTFGTEIGNTGDAQKTKVGHVADLAEKSIIGAIVMPKVSEYFKHDTKEEKPKPTIVTKARWFQEIIIAAIIRTEKFKKGGGYYLVIDAYDKELLIDFVYKLAIKNQDYTPDQKDEKRINKISLDETIDKIICEMRTRGSLKDYLKKTAEINPPKNGTILKLQTRNGEFSDKYAAKIHSHDAKAFGMVKDSDNASKFRNGHILRGNVQDVQLITAKKTFLILPRMNKEDYDKIESSGNKKEWNAIVNDKNLGLLTLDDIDFKNDEKELKKNFEDLRKRYVSKDESPNTEDGKTLKKLCKDLKKGLVEGKFLLKI